MFAGLGGKDRTFEQLEKAPVEMQGLRLASQS